MAECPEFKDGVFGAILCYSEDTVQLIEEIRSAGSKGGTFKEILVDEQEVLASESIPRAGKKISFRYLAPTNSSERFYQTIEDLAINPAVAKGRFPIAFYIVNIDYAAGEGKDTPELNALRSLCEVIRCLSMLATYHDEKSSDAFFKLVFLGAEKASGSSTTVLKTKITKEMLSSPALEADLLHGLCSENATANPHHMSQIGVFSASLQEFLGAVSQDQAFLYLIKNWQAFWGLYQINLTTFMSGFAFHKIKKEIAEAELKVAEQFSKVVNDITGKLLSIPVSIAAIVVLFKSESCQESIVLVASLLLASFLMAETVFNQQKQLSRVKDAKNIIFNSLEGKRQNYPEDLKAQLEAIIADFDGSQAYLANLLWGFRIFAWLPATIGCAFFAWRYSDYCARSLGFFFIIFLVTVASIFIRQKKCQNKCKKR